MEGESLTPPTLPGLCGPGRGEGVALIQGASPSLGMEALPWGRLHSHRCIPGPISESA